LLTHIPHISGDFYKIKHRAADKQIGAVFAFIQSSEESFIAQINNTYCIIMNGHFHSNDSPFDKGPGLDVHQCTSHRDGDWITWRCPHCEGYERRYNWQTGEMRLRSGNSTALHAGMSTREQNMEALVQALPPN
jgi:hypothetical protein